MHTVFLPFYIEAVLWLFFISIWYVVWWWPEHKAENH